MSRQETYVFDQLDNLTSFTDRRGKVTTYQYDGINRRTFAGYGTLPGPTYESTINYAYDGGNRLSRIVDSTSGTITPVFDGLDRLTSETTPIGSVAYTYDNGSRRKTTTVTGQPTINYSYDNANRPYQVTQGSTSTLIGYDNANRRSTLTLPNGVVLTYGYDHDSRINSMSYQLGSTALGSLTYTYDANGRRTQVGGSLAATGFPQAVTSAVYDVANELTNWNGTTISLDTNGNIQNDGVASYTWNGRNQLIARGATSLQYDSYGRRTLNPAGSNLFYEGWDVTQELSGTTPVANRILGRTDEFFSRTDSTGTYSPLTDALGSVLALANSSGNVTTQYGYDPFGNTTTVGSPSTSAFQYTGRENDGNGLYSYRARYYSPAFGRFISEDPAGFRKGPNLYSYVFNSPLNGTDPTGRTTINLGGSGNCVIFGWSVTGGGGFVFDTNGNVGSYLTGGGGQGVGKNCSFGFNFGASNANTICGFGGPFFEYGGSAGLGAGAGVGVYTGTDTDGTPIIGTGVSLGAGGGAEASANMTSTSVTPLAGRKKICPPSGVSVPMPESGPWTGGYPTMYPDPGGDPSQW